MRLDKLLRIAGAASRREARELAAAGRVTVDGAVVSDYAMECLPEQTVCLDGVPAKPLPLVVYMLNKPAGCVTATRAEGQTSVLDLFLPEERTGLFPVGRLDKDTEGLLLLTRDGDFCRRVIRPESGVWKTYEVRVSRPFPPDTERLFQEGLVLPDGKRLLPARIETAPDGRRAVIRVREGITHQVRRMAAAVGTRVTYLKRLSIGGLTLDGTLPPGGYRPLTDDEQESVFR
ncbi:MAG: rRNA pseudouridine synthase [Oscillospiraceae bacterium]|nr:rRNA pseudouridine synthase [Oscillospiraceae bacterium]